MVLTAAARPEAYRVIPAVIHHDGTARVQVVRPEVDPLMHDYLVALGPRIGAEVSINTSLNVGSPIVQTPRQALQTLKKSTGMHGLLLISAEGEATIAWHKIYAPPQDAGRRLLGWLHAWQRPATVVPAPHITLDIGIATPRETRA
jgi:carbamoyltransferase